MGWPPWYLTRDIRHNRNVAIEVLKPALAAVHRVFHWIAELDAPSH